MSHPSSTPQGDDPTDTAPGPVADDAAASERTASDDPGHRPRINPARMEVRVRRLALLGLVLVPVVYFIVQSLR